MFWKKANGLDDVMNRSDDGESFEKNNLNYINPTMQITKKDMEMRTTKKTTAILRHDIKKEYV